MSLSRKPPRQQSDSVPQVNQAHGTGDDPQDAAPAMTPPESGTVGQCRPVPCTLSVLFENVDPCDLTTLLEGTPPAGPPGTSPVPPPQTCPTCGRAYDRFDLATSRLLDLALVSREVLQSASAALTSLTHALEEDLP